jgi:3-deoxy-manno-octulosonate cytidylyltransferase (CMP-KDO synthetase)
MKILGIIPARYASSRFPGKPLALINGKSMIMRVYEQALKCELLNDVTVATDDERIRSHVSEYGGNVMMTSPDHRSGTERCAEVVRGFFADGIKYDAVVNIQGDEPFIDPVQISLVAGCFRDRHIRIATLVRKIDSYETLFDPNVVKVIFDRNYRAIYFSRNPLPYMRGEEPREWIGIHPYYKHIGIYGYRPETLEEISNLNAAPLETMESLEQLRWIENGYIIHVALTDLDSHAVDTPEDLLKITNMPH